MRSSLKPSCQRFFRTPATPSWLRQRHRTRVAVKGYAVHATDGDLGHVENILADDANWDIRYLIIATRNWLPGKLVQLAPKISGRKLPFPSDLPDDLGQATES